MTTLHIPPSLERKTAAVKSGIRYVEQGSGTPLLFLHGTLSNADTWRKIIPALSTHYRCIAIDLPIGGHSLPLGSGVDLSPLGIANIIAEFLRVLNIDKVVVVSNDTGGVYAQVFASLYPEKIYKLIFSNCEVQDVFPPATFKYLITAVRIPGFTYLLSRVFKIKSLLTTDLVMGLLSHRLTNEEVSELYLKSFVQNQAIRKDFAANAKTWSPRYTREAADKLKHQSFPVLILWGEDDKKLFPFKLAQQLKSIFKHATLIQVPLSKTYVQEDQPEIMVKEIQHFLNKSGSENPKVLN